MAEKYVNYVNLGDGTGILDLRYDTIKPEHLLAEDTAHDSTGKPIVGTAISVLNLVDSGVCGDNATWEFFSDGTLVISGSGAISADYLLEDVDWYHLEEQVTKVVINEGITDTGERVFGLFVNLSEVELPNSLITIGKNSFANCKKITNITIPNSVTSIESGAFSSSDIKSIIIPDSVVDIGNSAFSVCSDLEQVLIGIGVTTIGDYAFSNTGIKNITIPDNVTYIGDGAFQIETLTHIEFGRGITVISDSMFINVPLENVIIPNSITEIQEYAFYNSGLNSVCFLGTKKEWESITIGENNVDLLNATLHCEYDPDADTVDGWHVNVITDGSDPEGITVPTLTFVYTEG